ncbi:hypothetical protein [Chryseobacterium indoltheticum]|uniref:hypothetical protein n=1 Tax=Chryseobacterium indoltheticum TaxID=254 RepID=UPI003F4952B3
MNFISNINFKNIAYLFSCAIFFIFISCEEDLTKPKGGNEKNFPSQIIHNARIIQRDSGFITLKATAPVIEKYELIDSPYTVAKKGMKIEFFDKKILKNLVTSLQNMQKCMITKNSMKQEVM